MLPPMLNSVTVVQVCDATGDESIVAAGNKK
jgi:hypothetical protein